MSSSLFSEKQSGYWKNFKYYQTDVESKSDIAVILTVCLAQIIFAKKKKNTATLTMIKATIDPFHTPNLPHEINHYRNDHKYRTGVHCELFRQA